MKKDDQYKPSPIGRIPKEWDVVLLSDISQIVRGSSPRPAGSSKYFNGDYIPWVTVSELTNLPEGQRYILETETALTEEGSKQSSLLEKGTLLLSNSGATLGVPRILGVKACANDGVAAFLNISKDFTIDFLYYNLQSLTRYYREVVAPGNGQPNLNTTLIGETYIAKPPLQEQLKIVEVLNTCDLAINKISDILERKRKAKSNLMENLITGKIRFKEFNKEKWSESKIENVAKIKHGKDQKKVIVENGKYPILGTGGELGRTNQFLYDKPSVLIGRKGTIDKPIYMDTPFWTVDTLFYTELSAEVFPKWLFYRFQQIKWKDYNEASGVPSLSSSTISKIEILLPSFNEQKKIASVLSAIDDEIQKLNSQLEKLTSQKRGLMQLLLKGKVRVRL
jgi:type I restriction enzyme S subunit